MLAAVNKKYGAPDVVHIEEVGKPIPKDNEALVKIIATSVNSGDARMRSLNVPKGYEMIVRLVFGIFAPRNSILGMEFSGVVDAIGKDVTKFKIGDEVLSSCFFGAHAQYRAVKQDGSIVLKPKNLSFEEASAMCFGGTTALFFLKKLGNIKREDKVLINGASGAVGIAAIQLAKYFRAHVSAVCSGKNAELVKSLGADEVIDYTKEDFSKNGEIYDIIMDNVGNAAWGRAKNSLKPTGRLLLVVAGMPQMIQAIFVSKKHGKMVLSGSPKDKAEELNFLVKLAIKGKFKPHIDKVYPLEKIAQAHAYVDSGRKRGSVIISLEPSKLAIIKNKKEN